MDLAVVDVTEYVVLETVDVVVTEVSVFVRDVDVVDVVLETVDVVVTEVSVFARDVDLDLTLSGRIET